MSEFKKPSLPGNALFEAQAGGDDPAELAAAGHRIATLLVRGPRTDDDQGMVDRVLHLADEEGLGVIADLWASAPADTLPGSLWRLYLLRTWVHRQPDQAAREYAAGKAYAPVHEVLAGVVDPPGPAEVIALVDTVVRGIVTSDLDVTLDRAASFAHIVGVGRAQLDSGDPHSAAKLVDTALHLRRAAELERLGELT
ncbi:MULTISPECIES: hypothetical protein [Aeromicrobium]|uniref:hypothetical protein n=1 Tax=Aeromicrobium TaxID=2040 RepID=UPI0006FF083F|nr:MULTISPECIES: hypothetical protein [Aeromicrobium]KQX75588.1 hypothetical protein ASD10_10600 [Aeromicrobium sp. Root472D3]MCL8251026.1 hypothetical protein [Aeromicrobium fastidiosum]